MIYNQTTEYLPQASSVLEYRMEGHASRANLTYTPPINTPKAEAGMGLDDRLAAVESKVAAHEVKIDSLVKESTFTQAIAVLRADMNKQFAEFTASINSQFTLVRSDISSIDNDVSAIKNELTHKASHADIANAINSLTWRMIGGVVFLSIVMTLFKFLH